ncbi:hypothetical protein FB451DRAFT_1186035 [Mycena latifolia]|nr:hypothetical protein FB451DRAFT_1186035 [Mycena latifolia]
MGATQRTQIVDCSGKLGLAVYGRVSEDPLARDLRKFAYLAHASPVAPAPPAPVLHLARPHRPSPGPRAVYRALLNSRPRGQPLGWTVPRTRVPLSSACLTHAVAQQRATSLREERANAGLAWRARRLGAWRSSGGWSWSASVLIPSPGVDRGRRRGKRRCATCLASRILLQRGDCIREIVEDRRSRVDRRKKEFYIRCWQGSAGSKGLAPPTVY